MILVRWTLPRVVAGIVAAMVLVGGLVALATGVEHAGAGWLGGVSAAVQVVPITLVWLSPLCCGVGAALAMARIMARGEDVGLSAAGVRPWRTGWIAGAVGLMVGLLSWTTADQWLPGHHPDQSAAGWVWLDDGAYRPSDGVLVRHSQGRGLTVERGVQVASDELNAALQASRPRIASAEVLAELSTAPAQVERHGRMARVMACGALALMGWIPWVRTGTGHVGLVLSVGLAAAAVEQILHALAAQGHLSPGIAAWSMAGVLALVALATGRR